MIRFIDLTEQYFCEKGIRCRALCAFISTSSDRFYETESGQHIFHDLEEILEHKEGERMARLVPNGFFNRD